MMREVRRSQQTCSPDGRYRYKLVCRLSDRPGRCLFLLLNPSTENEEARKGRHPTRAICMQFAAARGYGTLSTCNLYAFRCRDPKQLRDQADPVGPDNDRHIRKAIREADMIVCAWGSSGRSAVGAKRFARRVGEVLAMLDRETAEDRLFALGESLTESDQPRHPLYLGNRAGCHPLRIRDGRLEMVAENPSRPWWHSVRGWLRRWWRRI